MYIFNYQGKIQNTELTFNPNYEFSFDAAKGTLTIRKSDKPLPKDFWGEGIYSVTALLGNNGAGKSTVMSAIMEATVEGYGAKDDVDAILVYENIEGDKLYYYCNKKNIKVIGVEGVAFSPASGYESPPISINTFYYTSHFSPHVNADIRWSRWEGLYNASDTLLLLRDYELKENKEGLSMLPPLRDYLMAHVAQNNKRICELLSNEVIRKELNELPNFTGPKYLVLTPNRQYLGRPILQRDIAEKVRDIHNVREKCLAGFIFQGILNGISTEINSIRYKETQNDRLSTYGETLLKDWLKKIDDTSAILPQFETFVNSLENDSHLYNYRVQLQYLYNILSYLNKILSNLNSVAHFNERWQFFYFDFEQDTNSIKDLFSYSISPSSISFFVNFSYSKNIENNIPTLLSSGELAILNLFSRLYDAIVVKPKTFANLFPPTLLLLDETELGLHPEWQRQYISVLLHFLQLLTNKGKTEKQGQGEANGLSFQIVLASHSPILLSDIPRACSNYLGANKETAVIEETFASNIFELYRNSFFMKNGMMGAFAEEKVKDLLERITNLENEKEEEKEKQKIIEIETEIEMIGDERIRLYLRKEMEKRIDQRPRDEQIAYYEKRLQELKGKNA